MGVFAVSITKEVAWRGSQQRFSNVYHYKTDGIEPFDDLDVIDHLVNAEAFIHTSQVKIVEGRTWGPTDQGPIANVTREIVPKDVAGIATADDTFYRELAFLIRWPLGRYGSPARPQFARKWLHTMGGLGLTAQQKNGSTPIAATPASLVDYIGKVRLVPNGGGGNFILCTANGRETTGPGQMIQHLEHRQFGR